MKVIGPYVISAAPHLHREVMNGATGDGHIGGGHIGDRHIGDRPDVNGQDNVQASPSVPAPAARQSGKNQKAQKQATQNQATQNQATRNQIPQNRSTWTFSPQTQASGPGGRKSGKPDAAANLVLSALNALPLHGIDRLTGMPVLLHRLNEFVVPIALPDSPYLLPVTEVDIWDAHPYAVTELPPAAVLATHPATAALGVLRALTALHGAGQVHGGLNAGQFWQVGREVRLAGAGLPWQPGAGADADMHALGQALDTLGARPAPLFKLEQMTARQALSALEGAMQQPEPGPAVQPERAEVDDAPLQQPALTRADLGWNGATDPQITPSGPGSSAGVPAAEVTWNRRKTDRAAPATMNQATMNQATANQTMPDSRLEEAVAAEVAALTVIDPLPIDPASIDPVPARTPAPLPYRSADDVIVIGEVLQASSTQSQAAQASPTANSGVPNGEPSDGDALHGKAPDEKAKAGEKVKADASREPGRASDPAPRAVLAPIRIGFTDLPETDVPADLPSDLPESPSDWTPQPSASAAPDLQMGRATRFTPAHVSESAPATSPSTNSGSPALNPAQRTQARHGQASQAATGSSAATGLSAGLQAASSPGAANRMQPLRIGWEEDHSWRVVKSGPEKRGALTRRFPVWVLALVLLMLLAGAAFWLLGRAGPPNAACCPVNFTVSGSNQSVQVRLVKAPPGSTLQPGAVIGTAPGLLNFPGVAGQYTLKFSAQGHAALTAAVTVPSGQPFAIVLK